MNKLKIHKLGAIASLTLLGCSSWLLSRPVPAKAQEPRAPEKIAQLFYPPAQDQKLVRVIGQGKVRQAADIAEIKILVDIQDAFEDSAPFNGFLPESPSSAPESTAKPVSFPGALSRTSSDLSPLVQALTDSGINPDDISARVPKSRPRISPFPFPSPGQADAAFVLVTVDGPTQDKIESVMLTAENHLASSERLRLRDVQVSYELNQCEQVQLQAFENAVVDAQQRAEAIASAMNATLSPAASVAEPFFNMFAPGCESGQGFSLSRSSFNQYEPGDPIEVVVERLIFSTYTIE